MGKNIIVISAHPDDETLGAGGTLLKHKEAGDNVSWVIITHIFENQGFEQQRIADREKEIETVARQFDFHKVFNLGYPTMTLSGSTLLSLVPALSKIFNEIQPEVVYCPNRSDAHSDHRVLFDAVMACTKSFRYPYIKTVLMYECISETEFGPQLAERMFIPNYLVDISDYLSEKIEIMQVYQSELGEHPFPRSIENIKALATFRGAMAGVTYAEAFQVVKMIV
jgi:LmbE family N-acetylglucosaminyl deacetylase